MDKDDRQFIYTLIMFIMGIVLGFIIGDGFNENAQQLGQSICEEEYDMDYQWYHDGELR